MVFVFKVVITMWINKKFNKINKMDTGRILVMLTVILSLLIFQGCTDNEDNNTARVQLKLIDSPGDYLEVNVNIIDVQYNSSEDEQGWRSFESFTGGQMIDLTELIGGVNLVLTNEILPEGMLKQIRLILGDGNTIVLEEEGSIPSSPIVLDTPSAQQSGLKLKLDTVLEAGFSYTFILDWDVQKSIVKAGNSGKYNLKPVIRVEAEAKTGVIEGIVTGEKTDDAIDGPVSLENVLVKLYKLDALEGEEPYATTLTNEEGYFIFEGLPTIGFEIEIEHEGYNSYVSGDITVVVNEIADAGTIELVVTE